MFDINTSSSYHFHISFHIYLLQLHLARKKITEIEKKHEQV